MKAKSPREGDNGVQMPYLGAETCNALVANGSRQENQIILQISYVRRWTLDCISLFHPIR